MKRELLQECMANAPKDVKVQEFKAIFCDHCRNTECALAGWGQDKFSLRVGSQVDRLFNPTRINIQDYGSQIPNFVDKKDAPQAVNPTWASSREPTPERPPQSPPRMMNIPTPSGGIVLGGSDVPASPVRQVRHDPWESKAHVVKPGARITVGGKKP